MANPDSARGRRIMVCGSRRQHSHLDEIEDFLSLLASLGFGLTVESRLADHLASEGVMPPPGAAVAQRPPEDACAVVSLGGDGTFLRVARMVGRLGIPILGVNTGHLGFLSACTLDDREGLALALADGTLDIEERNVLGVEGLMRCPEWPYALNEVAVLKEETASMITVRAEVDGRFLVDCLADGLVLATATGSTAYSLSAGGPILVPTLDNMVLSPLAPHSLTLRPLVLPGSSAVRLTVTSRSGRARVALDGRSYAVPSGTSLTVGIAPFTVRVMRRPGDDFASILRNKLLWGAR